MLQSMHYKTTFLQYPNQAITAKCFPVLFQHDKHKITKENKGLIISDLLSTRNNRHIDKINILMSNE